MAFKVAIFQPSSLYGALLCKHFDEHGYTVLPLEFSGADELQLIGEFKSNPPALVVVPLASDTANQNTQLAKACAECAIPLVYLSSHLVFTPVQFEGELVESILPVPNSPQAERLYQAEKAYLSAPSVVLRLPWVVDDEHQILQRICASLLNHSSVVVSDLWRACLVDTADVVRVVFAMAQQITCGASNWGVYHLHSSDHCSEAELVDRIKRILEKAGCDSLGEIIIGPVEQRMFQSNGWLGGNRCTNDFGVQLRSWRQGLKTKTIQWLSEQVDQGNVILHPDTTP